MDYVLLSSHWIAYAGSRKYTLDIKPGWKRLQFMFSWQMTESGTVSTPYLWLSRVVDVLVYRNEAARK